jgi:prophage regulatory protein
MISRAIRREELLQIVQLSESTIYQMEKQGTFPKRFALTERCVAWDYDEVVAWLQAKKNEARQTATKPDVSLRKARPVNHPK